MIVQVKDNKSLAEGADRRLWKWMWQRKDHQSSWKTRVWGAGAGDFVAWGPGMGPILHSLSLKLLSTVKSLV